MALRRTWNVGLRSVSRRAVPLAYNCTASLPSFSSRADVEEGSGEKRKKKNSSNVKRFEEKSFFKASSSESDPDSLLIKSLKKQHKQATELVDKFQLEVRGSFRPFEVVPNDGASDLTLRRVIGKEEVLVKCLLDLENPSVEGHSWNASDNDASGSDTDEDLRICQRVTMNVQISKNSSREDEPRVAFLCSYAKGESVSIEDIAYLGNSITGDYPYSGPFFPDLDNNLKQVFQNVVKSRGINSSLAETVMEHLTNQYQKDYLDWLKKLGDFLVRR